MKKLKISFLCLGLLSSSALLFAAAPQETLLAGNSAFEKGEYDKAMDSYISLVQQGFGGSGLAYNLGNTYYKQGDRGNAILWYERALRLSPRDSDIQFNLSLARSHLKDEDAGVLEKIIFFLNEKELGITTLLLMWICFSLLGASFMRWVSMDSWAGILLWASGCLLVISGSWFGTRLVYESRPYAIVVSPPGEVRNGPGVEYAVGFTIPEGSRVIVLNKRPEWSQVGVPQQGLKGWMPTKDVEPIIS